MLLKWIEKVFTKTLEDIEVEVEKEPLKEEKMQLPPPKVLVYGVALAIVILSLLTALEVLYILVFKAFNQEIFTAITGIATWILGAFFGVKAG